MNLALWKLFMRTFGKISGKTKEYLENDYESAHFCKKLAILNPDVEMNTDIDNYKIVLNRNEAEEIFEWIWLL
nr:hypothetical protein [Mycoplasmopsis bovis]